MFSSLDREAVGRLLAGLRSCECRPRRALAGRTTPWDFAAAIRVSAQGTGGADDTRAAPFPFFVGWGITDRCNSRCVHCWSTGVGCGVQLSAAQALTVADRLAESDILTVTLSGGEALLRRDLEAICARLRSKRGIGLGLLTNGILLPRRADRLAEVMNGPGDLVQASLDGPDKETYRRQRGSRAFERVLDGIRATVSAGLLTRAHFVATEINVDRLPETWELARSLGVHEFSIVPASPVGKGRDVARNVDPFNYLRRIDEILRDSYRCGGPAVTFKAGYPLFYLAWHFGFPPSREVPADRIYDADGAEHLCINLDGAVYASSRPHGHVPLGNLLRSSLGEIVAPTLRQRWPVRNLSRSACADCPVLDLCKGGDAEAARRSFGTRDAPDPNCPRVARLMNGRGRLYQACTA